MNSATLSLKNIVAGADFTVTVNGTSFSHTMKSTDTVNSTLTRVVEMINAASYPSPPAYLAGFQGEDMYVYTTRPGLMWAVNVDASSTSPDCKFKIGAE